jgi:hypothetical protein
MSRFLYFFLSLMLLAACRETSAFVVKPQASSQQVIVAKTTPPSPIASVTARHIFNRNKKNDDEDLSFLETRDMTRQEMEEYNNRTEQIMNNELWAMTVFR